MNARIDPIELARFVEAALAEDIGRGDLTTQSTVDPDAVATGRIEFRTGGVVCGLPVAEAVFRRLDPDAAIEVLVPEGALLDGPAVIARIRCRTAALLTGERLVLNTVARISGTATLTRRYVEAVAGTKAQILDTRKTTPLLRFLEKYAVRVGGGRNHRRGLDDGVLIKDNHVALAGGVGPAIRRAKGAVTPGIKIEAEVETLAQLREALDAGADMLLLDNMPPATMREAVAIAAGRVPLEASGGVRLETVRAIAETGVDFISAGALTHSAGTIDVALEIEIDGAVAAEPSVGAPSDCANCTHACDEHGDSAGGPFCRACTRERVARRSPYRTSRACPMDEPRNSVPSRCDDPAKGDLT